MSDTTGIRSQLFFLLAWLLVGVPLVILFLLMGNTQEPVVYGPSVISWLFHQWLDPRSESSHGFLIPLVSLYIIWRKRKELLTSARDTDNAGLLWIVVFVIIYWAGYRAQQPRGGVIAMIGMMWAIPYYLWGRDVARQLRFPCVYLIFAVPLGFLASFTFPLRLISCSTAVFLANGLGISAERAGTAIYSLTGQFHPLDVADPCSGLNSIIALSALTVAYTYLTQKSLLGKWILSLCSVPLAMVGNIARITTIVAVAAISGSDAAIKVYHDYSGFIVFVTAVILMTALGSILNKYFRGEEPEK